MLPLADYRTWIFDCDGVILDSNRIKTEAFRRAVLEYGNSAADAFIEYHRRNGGLSRFEKFGHFFSSILKCEQPSERIARALEKFSSSVLKELDHCAIDSGLFPLMERIPAAARRIVISGGDQIELRDVLERRELSGLFQDVFGSPETKNAIINREIATGVISKPTIFIGDSRLDYETAAAFDIDFVFIAHWTQFDDWKDFFAGRDVAIAPDLQGLADHFDEYHERTRLGCSKSEV